MKNILQISWRKNKSILLISIGGLIIGLSTAIILFLITYNEISYDTWYKNHDRIVSIGCTFELNGDINNYQTSPYFAYQGMKNSVPEIEDNVIIDIADNTSIKYNNQIFDNCKLAWASSEIFNVFGFNLLETSNPQFLNAQNNVAISEDYAQILFGNESAIGKTITILDRDFVVGGVFENFKKNTHFTCDIIGSFNTIKEGICEDCCNFYNYILIKDGVDKEIANQKVCEQYEKLMNNTYMAEVSPKAYAIPVTDIYFSSHEKFQIGKTSYSVLVTLLVVIAILVLLLAVSNYFNLFLIQCKNRSSEIGIRKVNGSTSISIAKLFMSEAFIITLISSIISVFVSVLVVENLETTINYEVEKSLMYSPIFISIIILLIFSVTILSGLYPSINIARLNPISIIHRRGSTDNNGMFSKVVTIFQSVITISLIGFMLIVNSQILFLKDVPVNLNTENILSFKIESNQNTYSSIINQLKNHPEIENVTLFEQSLGVWNSCSILSTEENPDGSGINYYSIKDNFNEVFNPTIINGEFFRNEDSTNYSKMVINEKLAKHLNLNVMDIVSMNTRQFTIIGIVKDFLYGNPSEEIAPLALVYGHDLYCHNFYAKINKNASHSEAIKTIENVLSQNETKFSVSPVWLSEQYASKLSNTEFIFKVINIASLLAIMITVIGLIAVQTIFVKKRTKEIGIRRVFGCEISKILTMLNKNTLIQTLIAGSISIAIIIYFGTLWLNTQALHTSISVWQIIIAILTQTIISLSVTIIISYKSATANPVEALRNE
ncbi:MAG: ABC transporter permease [Bacteroidales bacterium]|nr:ABC transporter permease [Bacteroidales bacterium]